MVEASHYIRNSLFVMEAFFSKELSFYSRKVLLKKPFCCLKVCLFVKALLFLGEVFHFVRSFIFFWVKTFLFVWNYFPPLNVFFLFLKSLLFYPKSLFLQELFTSSFGWFPFNSWRVHSFVGEATLFYVKSLFL